LVEGEQNLKFDGQNLFISSYSGGSVNSNQTLITIPVSSGNSGFFDYYVSNGTDARAGTVIAVWLGSNTQITDYSTTNIGGSTSGISISVSSDGTNITVSAVVTGGGPWTVKLGARLIF